MRVLSFDPGAERQGWGVIQTTLDRPKHVASSYVQVARGKDKQKTKYQPYRERLLNFWTRHAQQLIETYKPDKVATEIVPPVGFGQSGGNVQAQLATASITAVHVVTIIYEIPLVQISATTMKEAIGGHGKATKVKIRDGVLKLLPELEPRRHEWTGSKAVFEETDALGIGLVALGYKVT